MSTAFPPMDLYLLDHPSIPMLPPDAYMPFSNINHNLFHLKYVYINNYFNLQFAFLDVLRAIYHDTLNDFSQIQSFHPQYINRFSRAQHQIGYNYNSPSFLPTNTMNTVTSNYIQEMLTNIHNMVDILNTSHTEGISALRNAVLYLDREAQRNADRLRHQNSSSSNLPGNISAREDRTQRLTLEQINALPCLIYEGKKRRNKKLKPRAKNSKSKVPGLKKKKISKQVKATSDTNEPTTNRTCCICISDYKKGQHLRQLNCHHRFHKKCVDLWLGKKNTCPVCNTRITLEKYGRNN